MHWGDLTPRVVAAFPRYALHRIWKAPPLHGAHPERPFAKARQGGGNATRLDRGLSDTKARNRVRLSSLGIRSAVTHLAGTWDGLSEKDVDNTRNLLRLMYQRMTDFKKSKS